ncbi:unnamed protein product [Ilex paraguariensis]|uniref:Flagellar motor switch protein FliN-like C-terminal domain-containing protein n=1 Tax=Ilex paraguariensis TaxID=185542 RepID=A0ABC8TNA7_9AQUA
MDRSTLHMRFNELVGLGSNEFAELGIGLDELDALKEGSIVRSNGLVEVGSTVGSTRLVEVRSTMEDESMEGG